MDDQNLKPEDQRTAKLPVWAICIVVIALAAGLAARLALPAVGVKHAYVWDLYDNIGMGAAASEHGLLNVYSIRVDKVVNQNPELTGQLYDKKQGKFIEHTRRPPRVANYPPLGVTLFWLESKLFGAVDSDMTVNTYASRLIMSLLTIIADVLLMVAVWLIGKRLAGPTGAILAAAICWCYPPLVLDSSFWTQTDSWFLAPAAWTIWLMLNKRWIAAGICTAVACMLKPQGILLGPVILFAALSVSSDGARPAIALAIKRLGKSAGAAVAGVILISLPWTIANGLDWLEKSYLANVGMYQQTTLKAFNVWYLDMLGHETPEFDPLPQASTPLMGIERKAWGLALGIAAMVTAGVLCWRKYGQRPEMAVVLFAGLWMFSAFMWPTGVHERYIVYCMPFIILAALGSRKLWIVVAILAAVGAAELTHNVWLEFPASNGPRAYAMQAKYTVNRYNLIPANRRPQRSQLDEALGHLRELVAERRSEYRSWEYAATIATLGGYLLAMVIPFAGVAARTAQTAPQSPMRTSNPKRKKRR